MFLPIGKYIYFILHAHPNAASTAAMNKPY